jgi:predicted naringenin-chalcone synthase
MNRYAGSLPVNRDLSPPKEGSERRMINRPCAAMLGIGTAVPPYRIDQGEAARRLADALGEKTETARWAKKIFASCGVETRYTCEPDLSESAGLSRYLPKTPVEDVPRTRERMEKFRNASVPLGLEAARKALAESGVGGPDITHLITVSCTGLFLPGMDVSLIRELGLNADINRIPLNFLGCAAGLTAIRLSSQIVEGNPSAKVLIVCVELCTLHIQPSGGREALYAAAFFGDGAAACVVGAHEPGRPGVFALGASRAVLFPDSAHEMVWDVGDFGFDLYLSPRIPELIGKFVPAEIARLWGGEALPGLWAIHPGGKGIVDALQKRFGLTDGQTRASRSILRRYGNLSSATILFVLDEIRKEHRELLHDEDGPNEGLAVAFGPGLSAELMEIALIPSAAERPPASERPSVARRLPDEDAALRDAVFQGVALRDIAHRDIAHRDIAHRDIAHRDIAHRDIAHRDVAHRDAARDAAYAGNDAAPGDADAGPDMVQGADSKSAQNAVRGAAHA